MNLKPRFHMLTILFFLVSAIPAWFAVRTLVEGVMEQWAIRYAEKQVLYDKSRMLQPILREVALSRQLASSQYIREWARNPENKEKTRRALIELESFRRNFADQSYFLALEKNRHYFHNNTSNEFRGKEFRYALDSKNEKDAWYFDLIKQGREIHINVNPDPVLGITKLWIDVLVRDGNDILGIAGTGLDLTSFINNIVQEGTPGVTSLFVNHEGAIQLHRDTSLIDFASISKSNADRKTIELLLENPSDQRVVLAAMKELESQKKKVVTAFVSVNGKRQLAGIAYLPEIDWYEVTLMDLDVLLPYGNFFGVLLVYAFTLLGSLGLFNLALNRFVLIPMQKLDRAMTLIETGEKVPDDLVLTGTGEIGFMMHRFSKMADAVLSARQDLESKVNERTKELQESNICLEKLSITDPLTGAFNRRHLFTLLHAERERILRGGKPMALLSIDIDYFKRINDQFGHAAGDAALREFVLRCQNTVRTIDFVFRYGGEEFVILLPAESTEGATLLAERLRIAFETEPVLHGNHIIQMTASIGVAGFRTDESVESLLSRADQLLYQAKNHGRNQVRSDFHFDESCS